MKLRSLRVLTAIATVSALAVPAAGLAASSDLMTEKGIVQSIDASQIELRALDGIVASYAVSTATRIRVNGSRAKIADVRPGYVATITLDGDRRVVLVRAFGRPAILTSRGIVTSLTRKAITLGSDAGPVTIPLDRRTTFRFRGSRGFRWFARPGALVVVRYQDGGSARSVNVLKRARA